MRVNNNNNYNQPSFGIKEILTPGASGEFAKKITQMSNQILPKGHSCDVCHLKQAALGRVWAVITIPGFKSIKAEDTGFNLLKTIQSAVEKMVPIRKEKGDSALADAAANWWARQIQDMGFIGKNVPKDASHSSRTGIFQKTTPDQAAKFTEELKKLIMESLSEKEQLELDFFVESSIMKRASAQAGIAPYYAPFRPKMTIKDGIIQISSAKTAPEEIYRLPKELMPEEIIAG